MYETVCNQALCEGRDNRRANNMSYFCAEPYDANRIRIFLTVFVILCCQLSFQWYKSKTRVVKGATRD
jgi:hypothetical protein